MARLDRLPAAKTVAQIGSVIGGELPHTLLEALAGLQDAQLMEGLNELAVAELVFRRGAPPYAVYMVKHALVQDVAYTSFLKGKRQELHGHIAEILEKAFPDTAETQPDPIAYHCTLVGLAGRELGDGDLIFDRSGLLLADLSCQQIADNALRFVPTLHRRGKDLVEGRLHPIEF